MDSLNPDAMQAIVNNLSKAKIAADKEIKRQIAEKKKKQDEQDTIKLKENEEIESIKTFVENLAQDILESNQFAEWRDLKEEDCGENYFAIEKGPTDKIMVSLWSNTIGISFTPFVVEEIKTAPLARMIKRRFDWIVVNNIQPSVGSRY